MKEAIRRRLRASPTWVHFQSLNREGWRNAVVRRSFQRRIINIRPTRTASKGETEVRVLTWKKDWLNAVWSLKSFYHFAKVDYPLYIHDGGLLPWQIVQIRRHFPDATIAADPAATSAVEKELLGRGLVRCAECRRKGPMVRKFIDFYLSSRAERVISLDSDVLFFGYPNELILPDPKGRNLYNEDIASDYAIPIQELRAMSGLPIPERLNAGLSVVWTRSIDFSRVEEWMRYPGMLESLWLVEQTLHSLCSAAWGVELLPAAYLATQNSGLPEGLVAKHFLGAQKPLLYREGMRALCEVGFLRDSDRVLGYDK